MIGSALQVAIRNALKSEPALAGGRVYDDPPSEKRRIETTGAAWPMITIGDEQVIDRGNSCGDGWEVFSDVHAWSRPESGSKAEVKDIGKDVVIRLRALSELAGFSVIAAALETARTLRERDGKTEHQIITTKFLLQPVE